MDKRDIKKLERFFKDSPNDFKKATSNVLTSLAFQTRKNDIVNLHRGLIIRDEKFLARNLKVNKARSGPISQQVALAYSIERPRFTGWKEQQYGTPPAKKRTSTTAARGGNVRSKMRSQARLKKSNKIYKPEQFQGRSRQASFQFMLRVLGSRGGGRFLLSKKYNKMGRGLYEINRSKRLNKLQSFNNNNRQIKPFKWRTLSLRQLQNNNNIKKTWQQSIDHITRRYK